MGIITIGPSTLWLSRGHENNFLFLSFIPLWPLMAQQTSLVFFWRFYFIRIKTKIVDVPYNLCFCSSSRLIMWNVLFHLVRMSWTRLCWGVTICCCFSYSLVLASSLFKKCSTRHLAAPVAFSRWGHFNAALITGFKVWAAQHTEDLPCQLFAAATMLIPLSWTMAMILLRGMSNLVTTATCSKLLCDVRCTMSVLQWHGGEKDWLYIPVICDVMAGNSKVGFLGYTRPYISGESNLAVGVCCSLYFLQCFFVFFSPWALWNWSLREECNQSWCWSLLWSSHLQPSIEASCQLRTS